MLIVSDISQLIFFDWLLVLIVLASVIFSAFRGFIREALSLTSWAGAIYLAYLYADGWAELLTPHIKTPYIRQGLTVLGVFVVVLLVSSLLRMVLLFLIKRTGLKGLDHVLGFFFGLVRGILSVLLIGVLVQSFTSESDPWRRQSVLLPIVEVGVSKAPCYLPRPLSGWWRDYIAVAYEHSKESAA